MPASCAAQPAAGTPSHCQLTAGAATGAQADDALCLTVSLVVYPAA